MTSNEFETNLQALHSSNPEEVEAAVRKLGESSDQRAIPILLDMLSEQKDDNLRNLIALSLGDLKANEAVPILMSLISKPGLTKRNGSFVYALRQLDCSGYLKDIVELMCTGSYQVTHHALDIFDSLVDDASYSEKLSAMQRLKEQEQIELALPPGKNPKYDRIHFVREAIKMIG